MKTQEMDTIMKELKDLKAYLSLEFALLWVVIISVIIGSIFRW